jgi:MFS family permease
VSQPAHDPYAALRVPEYRRFAAGWAVASMGLQMQGMALGWEVYERTRDPMALGLVGLCRALPVVLLALPAGQIVDSVSRKRVLVGTQIAFALVSGLLAWASLTQAPLWAVYVLVVLSGCARVFNGPTRSAILPSLVPPSAFHNAVTWNSGVFHASAMLGPIAGGVAIDWMKTNAGLSVPASAAWPVYAVTGLACLIFGLVMSFSSPTQAPRAPGGLSLAGMRTGMLDGARHLWREKTILGAITLDLFAVLLGGATALLPVYAKEILDVGAGELGLLKASPYAGAVLMAFVLAHRGPIRRSGPALLWSVAGFGVATIVFGFSSSLWLSLGALLLAGAADNISVVVRHVLVQARTPEHLRGRVAAVNSVFIESSNELGGFESALVADVAGALLKSVAAGAVVSIVSGGVGTLVVVVWVAWVFPDLRRLGRLEIGPDR